MRLCTTRQMRSIDRRTIDDHGLSGFELMERAGCRVAETAQRLLGGVVGRTIEVVCGKGNNGGDGFVAARYLQQWGASVGCYVLSGRPAVSGDAARHLDRLEEAGLSPSYLADLPFRLPDRSPALIIDALLGTGLNGQPRDPYGPAIAEINRCPAPVLSVDIPSGLAPGCGYPQSRSLEDWTCVRADHTLAIGLMKVDLATYPGRAWSGSVEVADIGFPDEAIEAEGLYLSMPERNEMAGIIPAYMPGDHKGSRGRVAVVAGSAGMAGAATLASRAALRSGAGMVMLGSPVSLMGALTAKHTEVMLRGLAETAEGTLSLAALPGIESLLSWADVLAIGPGLTRQGRNIGPGKADRIEQRETSSHRCRRRKRLLRSRRRPGWSTTRNHHDTPCIRIVPVDRHARGGNRKRPYRGRETNRRFPGSDTGAEGRRHGRGFPLWTGVRESDGEPWYGHRRIGGRAHRNPRRPARPGTRRLGSGSAGGLSPRSGR